MMMMMMKKYVRFQDLRDLFCSYSTDYLQIKYFLPISVALRLLLFESIFLFSFSRYDPLTDRWTEVASMETCRIGVGVAVVNRLLYAVGGFDGVNRLSSVECYHPERNEWKFVASMNVTRSGAGLLDLPKYLIYCLLTKIILT